MSTPPSRSYPHRSGSLRTTASSSSSFNSQVSSYRDPSSSIDSDRTMLHDQSSAGRHQGTVSGRATAALPQYVPAPMPLTPTVPVPQDAHDPMRVRHDAFSRFFGEQQPTSSVPPSRTQASPPVYDSQTDIDIESLPVYEKEEDYKAELNRKLFIYGFLFFPLWIVGIVAPFIKPHRDPAKDNRTKEAQDLEDSNMRTVEIMWAKRCGIALFAFLFIVIFAIIVGVTLAGH